MQPEAAVTLKTKPHHKKAAKTATEESPTTVTGQQAEPKPLDLSIPFKATDDNQHNNLAPLPDNPVRNGENNLFATQANKTSQAPLQLNGGWVMSQEPETEKKKSVDGAGIVINVKQ